AFCCFLAVVVQKLKFLNNSSVAGDNNIGPGRIDATAAITTGGAGGKQDTHCRERGNGEEILLYHTLLPLMEKYKKPDASVRRRPAFYAGKEGDTLRAESSP
ncbi:MAG: hypothetical protein LBD47_06390, partial [Treponema sp.]|nr:hypothetical protein [Treponema sp.]